MPYISDVEATVSHRRWSVVPRVPCGNFTSRHALQSVLCASTLLLELVLGPGCEQACTIARGVSAAVCSAIRLYV